MCGTLHSWHIVKIIFAFLETFYESTVAFSWVYYPTYLMIAHPIFEIFKHLKARK
jgi:hypothetical protein